MKTSTSKVAKRVRATREAAKQRAIVAGRDLLARDEAKAASEEAAIALMLRKVREEIIG